MPLLGSRNSGAPVVAAASTELLAACAIFGFTVGNLITLPPLIIHREFDVGAFTVVMGLSTAASGIVGALGPGLVGLARSWSDGYAVALALCIMLELIAAAIVLFGSQKKDMVTTR